MIQRSLIGTKHAAAIATEKLDGDDLAWLLRPRTAGDVKLPPGQYVTADFPVLSAGPTPHVLLDQWEFVIDDGVSVLKRWNWKSFRDLPASVQTLDVNRA
jgi:DMSO/TMAO reductase YedYZ molybdopterin-dependent catalytic subunit